MPQEVERRASTGSTTSRPRTTSWATRWATPGATPSPSAAAAPRRAQAREHPDARRAPAGGPAACRSRWRGRRRRRRPASPRRRGRRARRAAPGEAVTAPRHDDKAVAHHRACPRRPPSRGRGPRRPGAPSAAPASRPRSSTPRVASTGPCRAVNAVRSGRATYSATVLVATTRSSSGAPWDGGSRSRPRPPGSPSARRWAAGAGRPRSAPCRRPCGRPGGRRGAGAARPGRPTPPAR